MVSRWQGRKAGVFVCCFLSATEVPSRKLTYPTWGKGKSSSNMPYQGDMLVPWRVTYLWENGFACFFGFECDDSMIFFVCFVCLVSCCSHLHMGVSLNGGFPSSLTPQVMIMFSTKTPWVGWGNPPFYETPIWESIDFASLAVVAFCC